MTKEEAKNTLKSLKDYYNDKNEDGYVGFDNEDNEALYLAIKALEQTGGIPVSEEPKEQGSYITTIKYGDKYAVGQRYYHGKYVGWEDSCVIAYMPLPEPYKAESEGEE